MNVWFLIQNIVKGHLYALFVIKSTTLRNPKSTFWNPESNLMEIAAYQLVHARQDGISYGESSKPDLILNFILKMCVC